MKERNTRRLLWGILVVLCVAIVGLTVGIVVVNLDKRGEVVENNDDGDYATATASTDAFMINDEIVKRFLNDDGYTYLDAKGDFEKKIDESDRDLKVNLTIYYVYFLKDNADSMGYALNLLESVEEIEVEQETSINLYRALIDFYTDLGYEEKASEAEIKLDSIFPEETIYVGEQG